MGLSYVANLPIVSLCPTLATALGSASIGMASSYNGAASVGATFSGSPPSLSTVLAQLSTFEANLSTAIGLGLPSLSFSVSDCATVSTNLNAASLTLPTLQSLLSAAIGVFGFTFVGTASAMGAAVTTQLATQWPDATPSSGTCTALVFGTVVNASLSPSNISITSFSSFLSGLVFGSGLTYAGTKLSMSGLCPSVAPCMSQASSAISAQLSANASLQASLAVRPPTLAQSLTAITAAANKLTALPAPSLVVSASAQATASLSTHFGSLITLGNIIARSDATAFVYLYTGAGNALGAALTSALATTWGDGVTLTSGSCTAEILGATDAGATTTMLAFFGGA